MTKKSISLKHFAGLLRSFCKKITKLQKSSKKGLKKRKFSNIIMMYNYVCYNIYAL